MKKSSREGGLFQISKTSEEVFVLSETVPEQKQENGKEKKQNTEMGNGVNKKEVDVTKKFKYLTRYGLIALIVIAVLCAGGIWFYQHSHRYLNVYDAQVSSSMVAAKAHANGRIAQILVADGEHVSAGDVIATIDVNVTDEQIAQLQQNVDLAKQQLAQAQQGRTVTVPVTTGGGSTTVSSGASSAAVESARARMNRMKELYEMGAISAVKRDQAIADYQAAAASAGSSTVTSAPQTTYQTITQAPDPAAIQAAQLQVQQAEAALANARQDAQSTEIVAPVDGTVYFAGIAEGDDVKDGQTIANIGNAGEMWVEAIVTPEQAQKLRLGQFVTYEIDGKELQGSIQDILSVSDAKKAKAEQEAAASKDLLAAAQQTQNPDGTVPVDPNNPQNPNAAQPADANNASNSAPNVDSQSSDSSDSTEEEDNRQIVRISLPANAGSSMKPGMTAVVKFAIQ